MDAPRGRFRGRGFARGGIYDGGDRDYNRSKGMVTICQAPAKIEGSHVTKYQGLDKTNRSKRQFS
ncbi:conserved hypothetical protein [Ricinus communis]|uniref:Uncharacterized protein n=1 Tax=Ricinus communis TaxID=3988 RepID=B9RXB9_RICCO|nr:conserved hypothetical protein [Ricinus communis]